MKKIYLLLFSLLISGFSFGQIWSEDFSSYIEDTGIEGDGTGLVQNIGDYPGSVSKWTLDGTNSGFFNSGDFAKTVSGVFTFQDTDGSAGVIWESEPIDISGAAGAVTFQLSASNNAGGFEATDYYNVSYSIDGGSFTLIQDWNNLGDATHTILGEKGGVDWNSVEAITVGGISGSNLRIQVQALNSAASEVFYLDNISVFEGTPPPAISITSPADFAVLPPGTTDVNIEFSTANLNAGDQVDITVTKNGGSPSTFSDQTSPYTIMGTSDGDSYEVTAEIVNGATQIDFETIDFSIDTVIQVSDLTALRAHVLANGEGSFYELMSIPTVTYTRASRNQKYIQDSSGAGILIDDTAGTIMTTFAIGDGISGLIGQTGNFGLVLQFVPSVDASVVAGTTVIPEVVDIATLVTNYEDYESELVRINGVTFADAGGTFASSTVYNISDPNVMAFRTNFSEADYIGQTIPSGSNNMSVLVAEFNGTPQVVARSLTELTLSVGDQSLNVFAVYPNPTSLGYVNISSRTGEAMSIAVYDILGKQVMNKTISNGRLDVARLNTGLYIMKVSQGDATVTKKLVIK